MKSALHPVYTDQTVTCVCGATYELGSTRANLKIDICSNCHPFFTGTLKLMDTEGRVERFRKRYATAKGKK
jgi:large subunit ribosomal protein L31